MIIINEHLENSNIAGVGNASNLTHINSIQKDFKIILVKDINVGQHYHNKWQAKLQYRLKGPSY